MRIRSTVAGLALGAGVLFLSAPVAMADNGDQTPTSQPAPTSTRGTEPRPSMNAPGSARMGSIVEASTPTSRPIIKPVGAPETGAGMEDSSSTSGALVIGGIALVVVAGGGTVAYRRLRKQG